MKKYWLMAFIVALAGSAWSQEVKSEKTKIDFVYELPQMNLLKTLPTLKAYLGVMDGVEFKGYCESKKLLMLKIDPGKSKKVTELFDGMDLIYNNKEDTSIAQALTACEAKETTEINNPAEQ